MVCKREESYLLELNLVPWLLTDSQLEVHPLRSDLHDFLLRAPRHGTASRGTATATTAATATPAVVRGAALLVSSGSGLTLPSSSREHVHPFAATQFLVLYFCQLRVWVVGELLWTRVGRVEAGLEASRRVSKVGLGLEAPRASLGLNALAARGFAGTRVLGGKLFCFGPSGHHDV